MTKFQELSEAYKQGLLKAEEYRRESYTFGSAFLQELLVLLECSPAEVYLFPVVEKRHVGTRYNAVGSIQIGDDGFWQFGVGFRIHGLTEIPLRVHLRRRGDSWVFTFGPDGRENVIALS